MTIKSRLLLLAVPLVTAIGLFGWALAERNISATELASLGVIVLPERRGTPDISLIDHRGQDFLRTNLQDKWTFSFFGYTHCPDICPITMALLDQATRQLAASNEHTVLNNTQYVFVSVDVQRDDYARVAEFIAEFGDRFTGVTGSAKEIADFAKFAGIAYRRMGDPDGTPTEQYLVEHMGYIVIFAPDGNLYGYIKPPFEVDHLVRVFKGLSESRNFSHPEAQA